MSVTHTDVGALEFLESRGALTLLDVGCGPGGQVQEAMNRGWKAFGGAFKNIATRQGMQKLFQRAYQRGGPNAVRKVQAAMQFMPSFTKPGGP